MNRSFFMGSVLSLSSTGSQRKLSFGYSRFTTRLNPCFSGSATITVSQDVWNDQELTQ